MMLYNPNVDIVNAYVYTKFVKLCLFILKIWSKNQILTSIKGRNSVANLQKMRLYNPNIDPVNDITYTKFGLNLSIHSKDMEQKPNSDANQGP